jgi:hypothetical protein
MIDTMPSAMKSSPRLESSPADVLTEKQFLYHRAVGLGLALLTLLLCLPFLRNVTLVGDEGIFLHGADRMLRGERLYSDFFEFLPPGSFLIVEGWFRAFGPSLLAARYLATLTTVGIAYFTYLSCCEASNRTVISAAAALAWVIWSQLTWSLQISHHWFTTLLSMISAWAALRSARSGFATSTMAALSGIAAGAATMITPTRGALTALACLTAFSKNRLALLKYIIACAVAPSLILLLLVLQGSVVAAIEDVIILTATRYAAVQSVPFAFGSRSFLLKYFYPIIGTVALLVAILDWRSIWRNRIFWTTLGLALAGFIGSFPRPDSAHIAFSLPLSLPLTVFGLTKLVQRFRRALIYTGVWVAFCFGLPDIYNVYRDAKKSLQMKLTSTARGNVAFSEDGATELLDQLNSKSETYFFYPYIPMLPFLIDKEQTSKYDLFVPYYTTVNEYKDACKDVMNRTSLVVIDGKWNDYKTFQQLFPAMKTDEDPRKKAFDDVLRTWSTPIWEGGEFQIRRPIGNAPDGACSKALD